MPLLQEVLTEAGATLNDLSAIGVGIGPGNFTGIRISVSAARGLALALDIPAVGVSLLDALVLDAPRPALACIDARRDHLYLQRFGAELDRDPELVALEDARDWVCAGVCVVGARAGDVVEQFAAPTDIATIAPAPSPAPAIARIAATRWRETLPRPTPLYLRAADAAPSRERGPTMLS